MRTEAIISTSTRGTAPNSITTAWDPGKRGKRQLGIWKESNTGSRQSETECSGACAPSLGAQGGMWDLWLVSSIIRPSGKPLVSSNCVPKVH